MAGNSGESVNLKVGDKSLGITTRDLIPLMTLIIAAIAGYFLWQTISLALRAIYAQQKVILERLMDQDEKLAFQTREFARLISIHDYNMDRPLEDRLPLEIDASWLPKQVVPELPLRRERGQAPGKAPGAGGTRQGLE